jgi:hypothetical protein
MAAHLRRCPRTGCGRDALFLTELEYQIEVHDPAKTRLVTYDIPTYTMPGGTRTMERPDITPFARANRKED